MQAIKKKDYLKVAKREKTFSTLAKKEGQGASKRAKEEASKGLKESAKDSRWEAKIDKSFAKLRSVKANLEKRKASK